MLLGRSLFEISQFQPVLPASPGFDLAHDHVLFARRLDDFGRDAVFLLRVTVVGKEFAGGKRFRKQPSLTEIHTLTFQIVPLVFRLDTFCHGEQAKRFRHADDV